ncbi:MAG: ATP-grasp domain-containing protein [Candidatus Eisenbacteria bacterium]|uniref:ATP-grasp domain-containing protein n=1 Tax=Eiseniibacteriota bacterium TaxID=2212470 RepID=A0A956LYH7_UNCEI|nr:ATP-grasp domain-containing protein [Candidatus Eisenbacteria bacterium]
MANRGEIAVRVLRGAREAGLSTVAVYSDADAEAPHVAAADRAIRIGPAAASASYLNIPALIEAARVTGAEAVHPGYGFLSENPLLAEACENAGLVFVGPPAEAIRAMGDKSEARRLAVQSGLPVIPGYDGEAQDLATLQREAQQIGLPLLVKPSAGGGGKGMKRIEDARDLEEALASARREAQAAFGDDRLILERYLSTIRHVEIQIFADDHGQVVPLFERECSVQRRHQKIVEESPSMALSDDLRAAMGNAAASLARTVGYRGAGTIEFVLDEAGRFYFLEMNTRLQVEHPVTELVTGLDLVHLQLSEAMGEPLPTRALAPSLRGHAIECRIYAEDPGNGFLPSTGEVLTLVKPNGPGIRLDTGIETRSQVGLHYDPILAKLIVYAETRAQAIARLRHALTETVVLGVRTNLGFLRDVIDHPAFGRGETFTDFIPRHLADWDGDAEVSPVELALAAFASLGVGQRTSTVETGHAGGGDPSSPWDRFREFRLSNGDAR